MHNVILAVFLLAIIIGSFIVYVIKLRQIHKEKDQRKKQGEDVTIPYTPKQDALYISQISNICIETSGFSNDRWLSKTQVINMLEHLWMVKPKKCSISFTSPMFF